jgi:hypothetical protein
MGIFSFFAHRTSKKDLRDIIAWVKNMNPDQRAGVLFFTWLTRGINLAEISGNPDIFIPIYHYSRGNEVPIIDIINTFKTQNNSRMLNGVKVHFSTNLAVSYPHEGYSPLVREMWSELFSNHTDLNEVITEFRELLENQSIEALIQNNDVSLGNFIKKPKDIMPHFLVVGHPLSIKLLEENKIASELLKN